MSARSLTIGRLANSAGVNLETVRYYERIGLMPAPARTEGGHRSYEPEHVQRLRFIRRSRELDFGIDAIRRLIALSEPGVHACCEVRDMADPRPGDASVRFRRLPGRIRFGRRRRKPRACPFQTGSGLRQSKGTGPSRCNRLWRRPALRDNGDGDRR